MIESAAYIYFAMQSVSVRETVLSVHLPIREGGHAILSSPASPVLHAPDLLLSST